MGTIDNLTFTYNTGTNRLQKVADATTVAAAKSQGFNPGSASSTATFAYDANGNMTSDPYKGMTTTYNHLNLPTSMSFGSTGNIAILYDYSGEKLRKTVAPTSGAGYVQDYLDKLEYRANNGGSLTLEAIYHDEGRIIPNGSTFQYEYNIQDHLGNTRLTFADLNANGIVDVPGDILQENHYYPFGMKMNYNWMDNAALDNRYQYNGKEFSNDLGLNWSDYGARWYDGNLGKWWSVDPQADSMSSWSPYNYSFNNPLKFIDRDGTVPNDPPSTIQRTVITQTFRYDKNDAGNKTPSGTDFVKETVQTMHDNGKGNITTTTVLTEAKIDAKGNVSEITRQAFTHVETRDGTSGPKYENAQTKPENINQSITSTEMQKAITGVSEAKKDGTSSLQDKADVSNHVVATLADAVTTIATWKTGQMPATTIGLGVGAAVEFQGGVVSPEQLSNTLYENETKIK